MLVRNGAGTPPCADRVEAGVGLDAGKHRLFTLTQTEPQELRAELTGADTCTAADITATGSLSLCRGLLAAGLDPDTAMQVYRQGVLALRIRSIGEAAKYTVRDDDRGQPRLRLWDGAPPDHRQSRAEASPVRNNGRAAA